MPRKIVGPGDGSGLNKVERFVRAIKDADSTVVKRIVKQTPTLINAKDSEGKTPLMYAASRDWKIGSDPGARAEIAEFLLENGARVDERDGEGNTALMYANKESAELLIDFYADVNATNIHGQTPLIRATMDCNEAVALALLKKHADADRPDLGGNTPLIWAAMSGYANMVNLLLDNSADPHLTEKSHRTAMEIALDNGFFYIASSLKEKGAKR